MKPQQKKGAGADRIRNTDLAIIHLAKTKCKVTEDEYRAILKAQGGGKTSSADMTAAERLAVIKYFKETLGFVVAAKSANKKPSVTKAKEALIGKIAAQLTVLTATWAYADAIAKRMFGIVKAQWCDVKQLHDIVAALEYKIKRQKQQEKQNEKP